MKIQWNNCFLCLNDLTNTVDSGKLGIKANLKLAFKYLLDTSNQTYDHVLHNVCQAFGSSGDNQGPLLTPAVQLCGDCEKLVAVITNLHLQLEATQMKIICGLKRLKRIILSNSKLYGNNENTKMGLEEFENWIKEQEKSGISHPTERKMLDIMYAFQTAVFEKDRDSVEIPRVFLKNYAYTKPISSSVSTVKVEPIENGNSDSLDFAPLGFDKELSSYFNDSLRENFTRSTTKYEVDKNHVLNYSIPPTRKRRREKQEKDKKSATKRRKANKIKVKTEKVPKHKVAKIKREPIINTEVLENDSINQHLDPEENFQESEETKAESFEKKPRIAATLANHRLSEYSTVNETEEKKAASKLKRKSDKGDKKPGKRGPRLKALPSFAVKCALKGRQKQRHRAMYSCDSENCGYTTISGKRFEVHLRDHETDEKNFTCEKCTDNRSFSRKQYYEFHMAAHDGYNRLLCDFCSKLVVAVELVEHMKTHVEKVFACPNCSHCSSSREKYLSHLKQHGANGKLWCDLCDQIFRSRQKFLLHLFEQHHVIEKVVCDFEDCKKTFLDPDNLRLHRKIHYQPAVCPICGKRFVDAARLKIHSRYHAGEKTFQCSQCEEAFFTNVNLQRHLIRVHGAEKHKCPHCPNEYSCRQSLLIHLTVHDGSGIPCGFPDCDKTFGNRQLWRRHQSCHTNEKNYVCEECGMQLKSSAKLKRHMLIHKNDRKFKCPHCDKAFIMKRYLVNHIRIHTGEKPFVCDICGKDFNQYAALYMHKRKHLGAAAPPINPDNGRPRVKHQEKQKHSNFCAVPTDASGVLSMKSLDNDSIPSSSSEALSLTKYIKPDLKFETGRQRPLSSFSMIPGYSQQQSHLLSHDVTSQTFVGVPSLPVYGSFIHSHSPNSESN